MCRDLCGKVYVLKLSSFCQSFDTLGAENFFNLATVFKKCHLLQVRFELAVGCFHRERATMTKGRFLVTVCAYSHFEILSNEQIIPEFWASLPKARHSTINRILLQENWLIHKAKE